MKSISKMEMNRLLTLALIFIEEGFVKDEGLVFYPYTSFVLRDDHAKELSWRECDNVFYVEYMNKFVDMYQRKCVRNEYHNCKVQEDNKVVFKFVGLSGHDVCIGFYDGSITIGSKVGGDHRDDGK